MQLFVCIVKLTTPGCQCNQNRSLTRLLTDSPPFSDTPSTGSLAHIGDLPPVDGGAPKLEHLGKSRPRRPKTRAVSRAILDEPTVAPEDGVTAFFEKPSAASDDKLNGQDSVDDAKTTEERCVIYHDVLLYLSSFIKMYCCTFQHDKSLSKHRHDKYVLIKSLL